MVVVVDLLLLRVVEIFELRVRVVVRCIKKESKSS